MDQASLLLPNLLLSDKCLSSNLDPVCQLLGVYMFSVAACLKERSVDRSAVAVWILNRIILLVI